MVSQESYANLIGKFKNAFEILKTWVEYLPLNVLITIAALQTFIDSILAKNEAIAVMHLSITAKRDERRYQVFRSRNCDINCLQNRIDNIASFLKGEFGKNSSSYKKVYALYKKITPTYPKRKDPSLPRGAGRSPSETSFVAVIGYAKEVYSMIVSLGAAYNPSNTFIRTGNFKTFVDMLDALNGEIAVLFKNYGDEIDEREELYFGTEGLKERTIMIKGYLASFPGGKQGQMYIEFTQAIKGV